MSILKKVVASLHQEQARLQKEMGRVTTALNALGHSGGKNLKKTGRTMSAAARRKIAAAQRLRWAKIRGR